MTNHGTEQYSSERGINSFQYVLMNLGRLRKAMNEPDMNFDEF